MKILGIVLGVLSILACSSLLVLHYYEFILEWGASDAFTGALPVFLAALVALICGIFALITKNWKWALTGLIFAAAGWVYAFLISFATAF
jgi:hypothetical protein